MKFLTAKRTCIACVFILALDAYSYSADVKRTVKETLLSKTPFSEMVDNSYTVSNTLRRIAFRIRKANKLIAVVDTVQGTPYDDIHTLVFSPDDKRFAYAAKKGSRWYIVVNHKQQTVVDSGATVGFIRFSPDSKKLLYILNKGSKMLLVYNNVKSKLYDTINENSIAISKDSRLSYTATQNGKQFNVINGTPGPVFDRVGFPVFAADGKQVAYWAQSGSLYYVVRNNKKSQLFESVGTLIFIEDGLHLFYDAKLNGKHLVFKDDVAGDVHGTINSYAISNDGSRVAYDVTDVPDKHGFAEYVVIDGRKEGAYEQVMTESMLFSPDGKELSYGGQIPVHETVNGVENEVDAYEWFTVRNGKQGTRYNVLQGIMVYSPDSKHFAYGAEIYTKRIVNMDAVEGAPYDDVYYIQFSPDSKHLVYSVKNNNKEFVVVDGNNGREYDVLPGQKNFIISENNSLHYLAKNGDNIYLVEETLE